jgi:hypothetical protein
MRRVIIASLLLTYLTACTIYFTGDDEPCEEQPTEPIRLIDPTNLACVDFSSTGCGDTLTAGDSELVAVPTWGSCDSLCFALDELTCMETSGCRVVHDWGCYTGEGPCTAEVSYMGCYPVDTTGPVSGGTCADLDAWECSIHDNCMALHDTYTDNLFRSCMPEWR